MAISNPIVPNTQPVIGQTFQTIADLGTTTYTDGQGFWWISFEGQTIGRSNSSATIKAQYTRKLFYMLWSISSITVTPARGTTPEADWLAGKRLTLPDVRGRCLITAGQGAGLTNRSRVALVGAESHVLQTSEMPAHTHPLYGNLLLYDGNSPVSANIQFASGATLKQFSQAKPTSDTSSAGSGNAHNNMQPSFVVYTFFCAGMTSYEE